MQFIPHEKKDHELVPHFNHKVSLHISLLKVTVILMKKIWFYALVKFCRKKKLQQFLIVFCTFMLTIETVYFYVKNLRKAENSFV